CGSTGGCDVARLADDDAGSFGLLDQIEALTRAGRGIPRSCGSDDVLVGAVEHGLVAERVRARRPHLKCAVGDTCVDGVGRERADDPTGRTAMAELRVGGPALPQSEDRSPLAAERRVVEPTG